uniref:HAT C-terminal dimerisation domain-containing protein n=1 Tax=Romanomermis culicivorax TaxID=13658 RepID=A0A915K0Q1_ROMCU
MLAMSTDTEEENEGINSKLPTKRKKIEKSSDFDKMLEEICHESDKETSSKINAELELQKYLDDKLMNIEDPMDCWKTKKNKYHLLANLARRFLCAPPTNFDDDTMVNEENNEADQINLSDEETEQ